MSALSDLRGLLAVVERSDWNEFYLRFGDWSVFMARNGGGANPMLAGEIADEASSAPAVVASSVTAPHIGTFRSSLPLGSDVAAGAVVAELELLGEMVPVTSDEAGRIVGVVAAPGDLVEYGQKLVELAAG